MFPTRTVILPRALGALLLGLAAVEVASAQSQFRWVESCQALGNCPSNVQLPSGGWSSRQMLPADMDLDGDVDVVSVGGGLSFTRNEMVHPVGATVGNFGVYTAASNQIGLALADVTAGVLADFDNDGDLDLAVATNPFGGGSVWILVNRTINPVGSPNVLLAHAASAGWPGPSAFGAFTSMASGDFDNDGDVDLVLGSAAGVVMLSNQPAAGGARAFANVSAARVANLAGAIQDIATGDFDGDGDTDFVAVGGGLLTPTRRLGLNPGAAGQFASMAIGAGITAFSQSVHAADYDADGDVDVGLGQFRLSTGPNQWTGGELVLLFNNGAAAFPVTQSLALDQTVTDIATGDVDEDGVAEIVVSAREEAASYFIGGQWVTFTQPGTTRLIVNGGGAGAFFDNTFGRIDDDSVVTSGLPGDGESIALADLDLDLDLDLIVGHRNGAVLGVFENRMWHLDAPRTLAFQTLPTTPTTYQWDLPFDMSCEFGVPTSVGVALGFVGGTFTPPNHVFPPTGFGVLTNANYIVLPTVVLSGGQGNFTAQLGPYDSTTLATLIGSTVYAQAGILSLSTNVIRATGVVQTTLQ